MWPRVRPDTGATGDPHSVSFDGEETSEADETRPLGDGDSRDPEQGTGKAAVGDSFGRYVILRELGSGGMAHVYVAYDPELNREVAVKVMRPGGPEGRGAAGERLLREAQAMARLEHVNVVRVYDVGVVDKRVWMAMELVRGVDFETWLNERVRDWREVVRSMVAAGRGLAAAHSAGIVHLDFKPRNILVGDDGGIRVVDFGLARPPRSPSQAVKIDLEVSVDALPSDSLPAGRLTDQVTEYGLVMGTPGYMAPEQLRAGVTDARTDQFAFCVSLWKALYGRRPFRGKTGAKVNAAVLRGRIEPPPSGSHVPARFRRLLERGLSRSPDDRFPSMNELLAELEKDPLQPYKRAGIALAAIAAIGVGAFGYVRQDEPSGPSCGSAREQLSGVWDEERRDAVESAILADGRAFAPDTWNKVQARLDAYADEWVQMHNDSCEATHKRGEQSEEMLDRRTHCLRERLSEMGNVTEVLAHADPTVVERAVTMVGRLGSIDACGDVARLQREQLPEDPKRLAAMERAQDLLLKTLVLRNAGKYAEAMAVGGAAALVAEDSGHLSTIAWGRVLLGGVYGEYGDAESAEAFVLQGLYAADRAGNDDRRANALIELIFVSGMLLGKHELAEGYAEMAQAVVDRIGNPPDEQARLWSNLGAVTGTTGDAERSIALYKKVLKIHQEVDGLSDENISSVYLGIGSALFWQNRYDEALPYYELSERILEEVLGPLHPRTATTYENLGTLHHALGNFDEAYRQFQRALEVIEPSEISPERLGNLYNGIGAALEGLERYEEAADWFRLAIQRIDEKQLRLPILGVSLANLAGNLVLQGKPQEALPYYERGIEVMKATFQPTSIWIRVMECSQGYAHLMAGDSARAFELSSPVIEIYDSVQPDHDALYRGECRLAFATALARTPVDERPPEAVTAARGLSASDWADKAARDLEAEMPRSKIGMDRLEALRKKLGG